MKKLFSLLLCAGLFGSAFAQTDRERGRDIILGKGGSPGTSTKSSPRDVILGGSSSTKSTGNSCQEQINAINRSYDNQVRAIQSNPLISANDKADKIRQTNVSRRNKIAEVRRTCGTRNDDRYEDRNDDRNNYKKNKVKGNNGNHYGWEKGKGNPHRSGGKAKKYKD